MNFEHIFDELKSAITISDTNGKIIYMNDKSKETFQKYGGESLIGKSLYGCHKESSNQKMRNMLKSGEGNIYTIEKDGVKKLIYQMPWKQNGKIMGLMELSIILPEKMPHFVR